MNAIFVNVKDSLCLGLLICIDAHSDNFTFPLCFVYICFSGSNRLRVFANNELSVREHTV